jgi:hypothetical protein
MPSLEVPGVIPGQRGEHRARPRKRCIAPLRRPVAAPRLCLLTVAARLGSYPWNSHSMASDTDRST